MAFSTSDRYQAIAAEWQGAAGQLIPSWSRFAKLVTDKGSTQMTRFADMPIGNLQTWNGGENSISSVSYGSSHEQTVALVGKGSLVKLTNIDVLNNPRLVEMKAAELLQSVESTVEQIVYSTLSNSFVDSVDNGASSTTEVCSNGHKIDTTGNGTGDTDQSNLLTAALSYDGLNSAVEKMQSFRTFSNEPQGLGRGAMTLICHPSNRAVAHRLCQSADLIQHTSTPDSDATAASTATLTGNSNVNNGISYITSSYLTSSTDWFLIDNDNTPVSVWIPYAPTLDIQQLDSHVTQLSVSLWVKSWVDVPCAGIVGSDVA